MRRPPGVRSASRGSGLDVALRAADGLLCGAVVSDTGRLPVDATPLARARFASLFASALTRPSAERVDPGAAGDASVCFSGRAAESRSLVDGLVWADLGLLASAGAAV
jgi:hypothetical protein